MKDELRPTPGTALGMERRDPLALFFRNRKTDALLMTVVGVAALAIPVLPRTRTFLDAFTLLCLFFGAAVALTRLWARRPARLLVFLTVTFIFTFTLEAMGTATGLVFGFYRYGDALGPKLLDVPLVIGLLWCLIALGFIRLSLALLLRFGRPGRWLTLLAAPLGCVFFDLCLEPQAGFIDYWHWRDGAAPLQNFIAWAAIAFLVTGFYLLLVDRPDAERKSSSPSPPATARRSPGSSATGARERSRHRRSQAGDAPPAPGEPEDVVGDSASHGAQDQIH